MKKDELIPLKQVAGALGVSRPTLWRASKVVSNFPAPLVIQRRVYWRQDDLPSLRTALERYEGRGSFECSRRHAKIIAAVALATSKKRMRLPKQPPADARQPDLFGAER